MNKKTRINRCKEGFGASKQNVEKKIPFDAPPFAELFPQSSLLKTLCLLVILGYFFWNLKLALASNMITCNIAVATDVAWDFPPIYTLPDYTSTGKKRVVKKYLVV